MPFSIWSLTHPSMPSKAPQPTFFWNWLPSQAGTLSKACHACIKQVNISIRGVCRQECSVVRNSLLWEPDLSPLSSRCEPNTTLIHDQFGWRQKNSIVELSSSIPEGVIYQPIQHRAGPLTPIPRGKDKHKRGQCEKASKKKDTSRHSSR